jgi:hypothetical protein
VDAEDHLIFFKFDFKFDFFKFKFDRYIRMFHDIKISPFTNQLIHIIEMIRISHIVAWVGSCQVVVKL